MTRKQVWVVGLIALAGGVIGGAIVSLVLSGPQALAQAGAAQKVVTAEAFHLVSPDGALRGSLTAQDDGVAFLGLFDNEGLERFSLGVSAEGTGALLLLDKDGTPGVSLNLSAEGTLSRMSLGAGGVQFLALVREDRGTVGLMQSVGKAGSVLSVEHGRPAVWLERDAKVIWSAP